MDDENRDIYAIGGVLISIICLMIIIGVMCSCANLAPGYRAIYLVKTAGDDAGKTIAGVCKTKRLECEVKHKDDMKVLQKCLGQCHKVLAAWVRIVKPSINSSLMVTWAGLETAREKRKSANWLSMIRPGLCALIGAILQWRDLIGASRASSLLNPLDTIGGIVCRN